MTNDIARRLDREIKIGINGRRRVMRYGCAIHFWVKSTNDMNITYIHCGDQVRTECLKWQNPIL